MAFEIGKEESPVVTVVQLGQPDRPAYGGSKDVLRVVGLVDSLCVIEEVVGIEIAGLEIFVTRTVKVIGARLGNNIDNGAAVTAEFCGVGVGFHRELGNRIQRRLDGEGASLVHILVVTVVVRSVKNIVVLILRYAVGGECAAHRIART